MKTWQTKKLGDIATVNPPKVEVKSLNLSTPVSFVSMASISAESGTITQLETRKLEEVKNGYTYFTENNILLAKITPCMENGKIAIAEGLQNGIGFGTTEVYAIRPTPQVLPGWIYAYLKRATFRKQAEKHMTGSAGQKRVPKRYLENIDIPIPPLNIQQQIVERLDAIRKLQELNNKEIERAEELFISVVSKWFKPGKDWEVKKLENVVVSIQNGYASRPVSKEKGIAQIRPHNITREGQLSLEGIKYVPFGKKDNYLVKKGDVIFNNTNSAELVGKTAYIDEDIEVVFSNHMTRIRVNGTKINPHFLAIYLHTLYQSRYFQGLCTAWVNQAAINSTLLRGLQVPLPSIEEQRKIVGYLSELKEYQSILMSEKGKLAEMFESLLHKELHA